MPLLIRTEARLPPRNTKSVSSFHLEPPAPACGLEGPLDPNPYYYNHKVRGCVHAIGDGPSELIKEYAFRVKKSGIGAGKTFMYNTPN